MITRWFLLVLMLGCTPLMAETPPAPAATFAPAASRSALPPLPTLTDHTGKVSFDPSQFQGKPLIINAFYEY